VSDVIENENVNRTEGVSMLNLKKTIICFKHLVSVSALITEQSETFFSGK
jgi:hypothetical protein